MKYIKNLFFAAAVSLLAMSCNDDVNDLAGIERVNESGYENPQLKHPGCLFSLDDLKDLPLVAENEKVAYNAFRACNTASMGYQMQGPFEQVDREPDENRAAFENDGLASLYQALQWYLTGYDQYAKNSMDIMRAWATTHKRCGGTTPHIMVGDVAMYMATAADILRSCYTGWDNSLNNLLKDYFMNVLWVNLRGNKDNKKLEVLHSANQGAIEIRGALAIAVFLDDKEMFDNVMDAALYHPAAGLISNTLPSGQFADFGRDMGHAGGMLMDWAKTAEIAWNQGVDLYGFLDNRLKNCIEYFCEYNMTDDDWSSRYELFGAAYGWYRGPSREALVSGGESAVTKDRNSHDNNFLASFRLYRSAYENRKGLGELKYTKMYEQEVIDFKHMLENLFVYTRYKHGEPTAFVPVLKTDDITETADPTFSIEGNKSEHNVTLDVNNGVYTLSGKGYNSSSCSFAHLELDGDGAIVVKIPEKPTSENGSWAMAGLMFRESMDENTLHDWVYVGDQRDGAASVRFYSNSKFENADINVGRGFRPTEAEQQYPVWLKLERRNGQLCAYDSYDGKTWVALDRGYRYASTTSWPQKLLFGLVVTSNSDQKDKVTAKFEDVKFIKYNN